jgi:hypothetical protein
MAHDSSFPTGRHGCARCGTVVGDKGGKKKRGPKGGVKHTPGWGHDTKSGPLRKKRFGDKAAKRRQEREEEARKQWQAYDQLTEEAKKLLGPKGQPKFPRPTNDT